MAGSNLFDIISGAAGGAAMKQLGGQFGLDEGQTSNAVKALLPAISGGLKRNAGSGQGLQSLLGALERGSHDTYLDEPQRLGQPEAVAEGNGILGHLLGSKEVSREVASRASARSGVDSGIMKQMLPLVAAMAMGSLSKQAKQPDVASALMGALTGGGAKSGGGGGLGGLIGGLLGGGGRQQAAAAPNLGMLGVLLDADGDGNPMDDIFDMVMKR